MLHILYIWLYILYIYIYYILPTHRTIWRAPMAYGLYIYIYIYIHAVDWYIRPPTIHDPPHQNWGLLRWTGDTGGCASSAGHPPEVFLSCAAMFVPCLGCSGDSYGYCSWEVKHSKYCRGFHHWQERTHDASDEPRTHGASDLERSRVNWSFMAGYWINAEEFLFDFGTLKLNECVLR